LGVSCWRRGCETKSFTWHASGAVAFLGGLLAKEPLLFALPALIAWPAPQPLGLRARLLGAWPLCVSGALYLAWRALATDSSSALPSVDLPLAAAHVPVLLLDGALHLALPLRVFPRALHEDYAALGPSMLAGALLVVGIAAVALVRARRTHPLALFSALFFACTLAPVALVTVRLWPGFGRYLYLPASLALPGAALALHRCSEQLRPQLRFRRLPEVAAVAYLLALTLRSYVATYAYASDETLFSAVIAEAPERSHGYGFWGMSEAAAGRHARAVPLLRAAVERSPDERRWAAQYGSELLFSGDAPGALQIAERYIARLRSAPEFHLLAAYALLGRDHHAAAVHVLECLLEDPKHAQGRDALTFLRSQHPQAEDFRAQFRALFRESRYASLQGGG
jgi:hypothetical protein